MARLVAILPDKLILISFQIIVELLYSFPNVNVSEQKIVALAESFLNLRFNRVIAFANWHQFDVGPSADLVNKSLSGSVGSLYQGPGTDVVFK